jgi:3-dehydroquinate synthase
VCSWWPRRFTGRFVGRRGCKVRIIPAVQTLQIDVGHSRYPITIGPGLLGNRELLRSQLPANDCLIVTNTTVARLYLGKLREGLAERRVAECILPDGEQHKTLQTASWVFDAMVGNRLHRDAAVLALGGGVIGDVAGFAAACYQRGIGYIQVPTTLLAQVDSSVGGKTGVNHSAGKNLIGAFHQPLAVITDTDTLATLPDRELRSGLAEVIKYGCVWDPLLFDWLDHNMGKLLARNTDALTYAIARSCEIKATVVAQDEREHNLRAILNYGHTFGHAIEAATAYVTYLHGEAVGLGMLIAADLSHRLGLTNALVKQRIHDVLVQAGLPTTPPRIGAARILELIQLDKKVRAGEVRLVLLEKIGRAVVIGKYSQGALDATLTEYFA